MLDNRKGKPVTVSNIEEQATTVLMKGCGILKGNSAPDEEAKNKFHKQFVDPMAVVVEDDFRAVFGIPKEGGADSFSALVINADA